MSELALKRIAENKAKHARGEDARVLDLGNCGLTEVPEEVGELVWIEGLVLSRIIAWFDSEDHGEWEHNYSVNKGDPNKIEELPETLSHLTKLKSLYLNELPLINFHVVSQLKSLVEIQIMGTQIDNINPLKGLPHLQIVFLNSTKIKDISPISFCPNVRELIFSGTKVKDISPLKKFSKFKILEFDSCQVETLEPIVHLFQKRFLYRSFNGNPFVHPPPEIARQGDDAILRYFEELKSAKSKGETIILSEAKCLIVGAGGSGKTSLARKLLHPNNPLPAEKETTQGIDIHPHNLKLPDGTDFRLNIWDFGGQEIYHATHQFFLTKRSLYILLDDTRKDEKTVNDPTFNYWLQVAELYGGGSPLLIVQNEKGDRSKQLDLKGMQGRFGFVKDARAANLLTCRGLDEVWSAIQYWLKQLPHIGEEQPKAWLDIRRELERLAREEGRDFISLEKYYEVCAQHTIPERERALFLSGYLHDFGAFLHFQDHPLLRKMLVLNNQWATDAVYKVLDFEPVKKAFGWFTRTDLSKIWSDARYADQHDELLALMEKFELCYKLPDEKTETWLAPQLFSVLQPDALVWDESDNLQIRYEYEFMPKGLLSQHIVRMHRYVQQPDLAWKSGVVFERAGSQALVTEAWGSRNIRLRARGPQAKELLTLLAEDFDKMHERLEGLRVKKMIPCNCRACAGTTEPHFYEYDDLARRKSLGKRTIECKISFEDVQVSTLLDGVFVKITPAIYKEDIRLDSESKERLLVGEVLKVIASANQIAREKNVSDHGIDMEIEFKNDKNEATGKLLFLQLKSGDSYLKRRKDGTETFDIPKDRHFDYWKDSIVPVMLIIRRSNGEILWMEIREHLQQLASAGERPRSIVFQGEILSVDTILQWRAKMLE